MKTKKTQILVIPLHYVLSDNTGSEFGWSFELYKGLSEKFGDSVHFVTGGSVINSKNLTNLRIINPEKINLSLWNVIRFHLLSQLKCIGKAYKSTVIFHILPFSIDRSVNLLFFLPFCKAKRIIGPIQLPLKITDSDLDMSDARGFKQKGGNHSFIFGRFLRGLNVYGLLRYSNHLMLRRANKIIALNSEVKNELIARGIEATKITVIPTGIDIKRYESAKAPSKNDIFTLITISYLLKRKNVDQIIEAIHLINNEGIKIKAIIVGDGPQKDALIKLTNQYKLDTSVSFAGYIDNNKIKDFYKRADCFVSMSSSESWGQVYLEAMVNGLPVIATKNTGSESIIDNGITGYTIEVGDINQLVEHIKLLMKNIEKRKEMGYAGRKRAENKFSWERNIIPKYIDILVSILQ